MRMGIENLKEAVAAGLSVGESLNAMLDGFQFNDISKFVEAAKRLPAAIKDGSEIVPEYADLDDAERSALTAFIDADFELPGHVEIEHAIETGLAVALSLSEVVKLFTPPVVQPVGPA